MSNPLHMLTLVVAVSMAALHGTGGFTPALAQPYEAAKLLASDGGPGDEFGYSVAVDGDRAVIGAPYDDDLGADSGSAYVFRFDGYNWVQEAKLLPGDAPPGDSYSPPGFGYNVAIDGETIAVSAVG